MKATIIIVVLLTALLLFDTFANDVFSLITQIDPQRTYPQVYYRNDAGVAPVADKKPLAIEEQAIEAFKSFNQLYDWGNLNTVRKMRLLKIADNQYLALVNRYEDDQYPVIREIELFDNQVFFFIVFPKYNYGMFDELAGSYTSLQDMMFEAKNNNETKLLLRRDINVDVTLSAKQINDFCTGKNVVEFEFLLTPPTGNPVHDEGWKHMILTAEKDIVQGVTYRGAYSPPPPKNRKYIYDIFPLKIVMEENFDYKFPPQVNYWCVKEHEEKLYGGKSWGCGFRFDANGICGYHEFHWWHSLGELKHDQLSEFACLMLKNDVLIWELDKKDDQYVLTRLNFEVDGVKVRYFDESKQ